MATSFKTVWYDSSIRSALINWDKLKDAINAGDEKAITVYRGRFLRARRRAYMVNKTPAARTLIHSQALEHKKQIEKRIRDNKINSDIKNPTFSTELGLKIRRLANRVRQVNFAANAVEKKNHQKAIFMDSAGLAATVALKAPLMVPTKIISKVGKLACHVITFPIAFVNWGLANTASAYTAANKGDSSFKTTPYNKTFVYQLTDALANGITSITSAIYKQVGKF